MEKMIEAIYEQGVLKPLWNPGLAEHQRVMVQLRPLPEDPPKKAPGDKDPAPASGHRQRENAWRQRHPEILRAYAGQWVVLEAEEIVTHGSEPVELVRLARERGIRSPYLFFVEPPQPGVAKMGL